MGLGQPEVVIAQLVRPDTLREQEAVEFCVRSKPGRRITKIMPQSEFHAVPLGSLFASVCLYVFCRPAGNGRSSHRLDISGVIRERISRYGLARFCVLSRLVLSSQKLGRDQDLSQIEVKGAKVNRDIASVSVAQTRPCPQGNITRCDLFLRVRRGRLLSIVIFYKKIYRT